FSCTPLVSRYSLGESIRYYQMLGMLFLVARRRQDFVAGTPMHASWLYQVEIYFSILKWKAPPPKDFATSIGVEERLWLYEALTNRSVREIPYGETPSGRAGGQPNAGLHERGHLCA